jgi:ubiquinone/menaquinone biosynthesis C-methylase UbiE
MTDYSTKFWDRIAERYAKNPVADETTYQKKLAATQQYLRPGMKVFEFGCGTGSTAIVHAPLVNEYQAIDVSPKMIDIAKRKLAETQINNLTFNVAALEDFPTQEASFDAVLALSILHLMNDWDEAIRRVYKMLKPGGIFVSSTACIADAMPYLRYILPIGKFFRLVPLVHVFSEQELKSSFRQAEFDIEYELATTTSKDACFLIAGKKMGE